MIKIETINYSWYFINDKTIKPNTRLFASSAFSTAVANTLLSVAGAGYYNTTTVPRLVFKIS